MNFSTILSQVIILLLIMIIGFFTRKQGLLDESVTKKLSELLLKVTSPLLVISSFQVNFTQDLFDKVLVVFIFSILAHVFSVLLGQVLFLGYKESTKKIMKFSAIYSNCGFMGFPLLDSLFGKTGILLGSVYVAAFNIFLWTNGVMIFSNKRKLDKETLKKALLNPGITSVIIGLLLFLFSIKLPYPLARTTELVGSMTIPLSMLIVGANIASCKFKQLLRGFELYYITIVRLLLIPLLSYIFLKILGFSDMLLTTCLLLVAMPAAATTTIFAEMYGGDVSFASRVVVFSTIVSIITIPLIMLLH